MLLCILEGGLDLLEVPDVMHCVLLCMLLCMLEPREGGLCSLEVVEVMRCVLLCMLEAVEGGLWLLEELDAGRGGGDALFAALYAGNCGG